MKQPRPLSEEADALRESLSALIQDSERKPLSSPRRRQLEADIRVLLSDLETALVRIDPVALPTAVFDPSNPAIVGRFTALALVAQDRHPLVSIAPFYGAGVYAIYYRGSFPLYSSLSGSETPIYVGKASPATNHALTPRDQGERLAARLNEHRKNIMRASTTLSVEDFDARFLVVQSGSEKSAEDYLISLFRPIWNNEVDILHGLGKHGDSHLTRTNKRSPWDTLHPGRKWAAGTTEDARTLAQIEAAVAEHFAKARPYRDFGDVLRVFLDGLRQR